jgi:prepilin peptidase CpaA
MFTEVQNGWIWGAMFTALLLAGCVTDIRSRRIPNPLVLLIAAGGLGYSIATKQLTTALGSSLAGLVLGFSIWIVFYVVGVLGAGDVKFFAAAGAWLGPSATWRAALVAALFGGVLAVLFLIRERRLGSAVREISLAAASRSTAVLSKPSDPPVPGRTHLPYGVALAAGALAVAWWPELLALGRR